MDVRRATLLILLLASGGGAAAQSDSIIAASAVNGKIHEQFLVLTDGRIVSGKITPRPDGYDVEVAAGRMFINSDRVRFSADRLPDAYDRMRDSIPEFTPANHLELARWCLNNKLHSQARREVLDALFLDPNRDDAKRMLRSLEQTGQTSSSPANGTGLTEFPSQMQLPKPAIETRSLAGLNRSVAHSFVRNVQPLLMNKCATSGCHGTGTKSEFELASTHRGSTPAIAERNLAAVLKQIDFLNPAESALLVTGQEAHGTMPYSAFQGRAGALQMKSLKDWVQQAAHDIAPNAEVVANKPGHRGIESQSSGILQVSATSESRYAVKKIQSLEAMSANPHTRQLTTEDTDDRFIQEAKYANRQDAFSPDKFNLRFHGRVADSRVDPQAAELEQTPKSDNIYTDAQDP
jgi:hypothetical protein